MRQRGVGRGTSRVPGCGDAGSTFVSFPSLFSAILPCDHPGSRQFPEAIESLHHHDPRRPHRHLLRPRPHRPVARDLLRLRKPQLHRLHPGDLRSNHDPLRPDRSQGKRAQARHARRRRDRAARPARRLRHGSLLGIWLLGICFWREGHEAALGPERRGAKGG